jgi:hypothetical protein
MATTQERIELLPVHAQPKWFVLRDHQIGACRTALLVKVDGQYRHGFAQTAGRPYDSEEQAVERKRAASARFL